MAEEVEEVEVPKKSKLPFILGGLAFFVLGGGAGFGASLAMGGDQAEAAELGEDGEPLPEATPSPEEVRVVHSLGQFTVNLKGTGGGRILRMEIQVETTEAGLPTIEEQTALLRDSVITLVSDYTYADVEGLDGKTRLRDELLGRVNTLLPETGRVERVYFTEFVVQ
jgi:flagellar basal body-associated protein FliL